MSKRLAIAGSGAIACGLAATAAHHGPVLLLARSESSAERARATVEKTLHRLGAEVDPEHVEIVTDPAALAEATFVVEAVVEDHDVKAALLAELHAILDADAILASTTSSLSVERLAQESGRPDRFLGLHVFNPVTKMQLVELIFPTAASERDAQPRAGAVRDVREDARRGARRARASSSTGCCSRTCSARCACVEETGMDPADVDTCMRLGAGHPMGPLALLDLVGLDVSKAIGETIGEPVPARVRELVGEGALGRKSGRGLHAY